jgi:hypothetical protein
VTSTNAFAELALPPLWHVGMVVFDLDGAATNFERRWGTHVTDVSNVTFENALFHHRPATIAVRRGLISSGSSQIELTQPLTQPPPFTDFLEQRKGDDAQHLAYVVDDQRSQSLCWTS